MMLAISVLLLINRSGVALFFADENVCEYLRQLLLSATETEKLPRKFPFHILKFRSNILRDEKGDDSIDFHLKKSFFERNHANAEEDHARNLDLIDMSEMRKYVMKLIPPTAQAGERRVHTPTAPTDPTTRPFSAGQAHLADVLMRMAWRFYLDQTNRFEVKTMKLRQNAPYDCNETWWCKLQQEYIDDHFDPATPALLILVHEAAVLQGATKFTSVERAVKFYAANYLKNKYRNPTLGNTCLWIIARI